MKLENCPYCEIKYDAEMPHIYEALNEMPNGKCECGAYIDRGQQSVKINGYRDIYKGAVTMLEDLVSGFNRILGYGGIDLSDYFDDDEMTIKTSTREIVRNLFAPYCGGTTASNLLNALGIEDEEIEFTIKADDTEV